MATSVEAQELGAAPGRTQVRCGEVEVEVDVEIEVAREVCGETLVNYDWGEGVSRYIYITR